ncbi:MAG TPA: segregation/condensation protein A [Nitrospirota bacterium]
MDYYNVKLPLFEGPLDLLLHLIKKSEVEIYDISITEIAEQYLEYIDMMKELDLDIAGEFLVMAATLTQIKSRMLLPPKEGEEEEEGADPRAELIARLVEYKKFKEAAEDLGQREEFWREVFVRQGRGAWEDEDEPMQEELFNFGLFDLLDAFRRVLKNMPVDRYHEIHRDSVSITDKINQILALVDEFKSITFGSLFENDRTREQVVVSFLALLELARRRAIKLMQVEEFGPIRIMKAVADDGVQ